MNRKNLISAAFFLLLLTATIVVIFQGNDMNTVVAAMQTLSPVYLVAAALTALFFTSAEGIMIWYLLDSLEGKTPLFSCIKYSFVGFFYSGITPSATGGQPMQLYYMQKEGHKVSDSSVVLMTVAEVTVSIFTVWYSLASFVLLLQDASKHVVMLAKTQ